MFTRDKRYKNELFDLIYYIGDAIMKPIFKEEKRSTLSKQVAAQLRKAIETGQLAPGDRLIETDIAKAMNIGRSSVREAIHCLEKEGLITTTPFKGAHISLPDSEQIIQTFEVIANIQGICARLAVERMTDLELEKLEALHQDLERYYAEKNLEEYLNINGIFHKFILEITKNKVLNDLVTEFRKRVLLYKLRQLYVPNLLDASIKEHRQILAAFQQRDPKQAEDSMQNHMLRIGEAVLKSYEKK